MICSACKFLGDNTEAKYWDAVELRVTGNEPTQLVWCEKHSVPEDHDFPISEENTKEEN